MTGSVERSGNRVSIKGRVTYRSLRPLCAALHNSIERSGFSEVILDFSSCSGITEAVMLPLLPVVTKYRGADVEFKLFQPADEELARLFRNTNWAHYIDPKVHSISYREGGHVPALQFEDGGSDDISEIIDRVMELILGQLQTERSALGAVEWSLSEIMDNVLNHAESEVGGFVQATAFRQSNRVEFIVADSGIGIPKRMGIRDHRKAVRQAIDEGVTSDPARNAGNGLYGSYRIAFLSGGQFEINSLLGHLFCNGETEKIDEKGEKIPYSGTSVRCSINLDDPHLLSNALEFKGQVHNPPFDYIERHFENNIGDIVFSMKDEAQGKTGSRSGGRHVRKTIENLMNETGKIAIDFSGVGIVSSSFADEVFGRLFVQLGPRAFMTRIEMRNVGPVIEGLIDRAIVQRTRLGNGGAGS